MSARLVGLSSVGIVVLLVLVSGLGVTTAKAGSVSPCANAQSALESGNLPEAESLFAALRPADLGCARQGLSASSALLVASHLIAVGLDSVADTEIISALQADPPIILTSDLLRATVGGPGIALAETLNANGFHDQAVHIVDQAVEHDPTIQLDPDARAILDGNGESLRAQIQNAVWNFRTVVLLLAAAALWIMIYPRVRRRLHLQTFTVDDAVTEADPASLRGCIAEEMRRLVDESARTTDGKRFRLDLAGPYEDDWAGIVQVSGQIYPPLQIICTVTGIVLKHFPSRSRMVTGAMAPDVAVRLGLQTIDKVSGPQIVLAHKNFGFPDPVSGADQVSEQYAQLALPAAAWIILTRFDNVTLGGARRWRSFAHFAAGHAWQEKGELAEAERCYRRARDEDRGNTAAEFNLAALQQRADFVEPTPSPPAQGTRPGAGDKEWDERLLAIIDATKGQPDDLQRLRSLNLLALGLQDAGRRENLTPQERDSRRTTARRCATELAVTVERAVKRPGELPEDFVQNSRGAALSLVASLIVPTTDDLTQVSTEGFVSKEASSDEILRLLRNQGRGAPERLVAFVRANCHVDDQVNYNLYQYYFNRAEVAERNATACQLALTGAAGDDREALLAQLDDLQAAQETAVEGMSAHRDAIGEDADPVVRARVSRLDELASQWPPPDMRAQEYRDYADDRRDDAGDHRRTEDHFPEWAGHLDAPVGRSGDESSLSTGRGTRACPSVAG